MSLVDLGLFFLETHRAGPLDSPVRHRHRQAISAVKRLQQQAILHGVHHADQLLGRVEAEHDRRNAANGRQKMLA